MEVFLDHPEYKYPWENNLGYQIDVYNKELLKRLCLSASEGTHIEINKDFYLSIGGLLQKNVTSKKIVRYNGVDS
jgi:hypothetical protein